MFDAKINCKPIKKPFIVYKTENINYNTVWSQKTEISKKNLLIPVWDDK